MRLVPSTGTFSRNAVGISSEPGWSRAQLPSTALRGRFAPTLMISRAWQALRRRLPDEGLCGIWYPNDTNSPRAVSSLADTERREYPVQDVIDADCPDD